MATILDKINKRMLKAPIIKQVIHYFTGSMLAKAIQFASLLIFARILTPSEYGSYNVYLAYSAIFTVFLTLNLHTAVSRYFYESQDDFYSFVGTTLAITLCVGLCTSIVLLVNKDIVNKYTNLPVELIELFVPFAFIESAALILMQIFQPNRKTKEIAVLTIARAVLGLIFSIVYWFFTKEEALKNIINGYLIGNFIAVSVVVFHSFKFFKISINWTHLVYIFKYTFPLVIYTLTTIILAQSDKIMIDRLSTKENVGYYSLASNLSMIAAVIYGAILSAWTPTYYEDMKSEKYEKLNNEVKKIARFGALVASLLIILLGEIARIIFPNSYHEGLFLIPILIFGYFIDLGWQLFGRHFGFVKKTYYITCIGIVVSIMNIIFNYYTIQKYGYYAAAVTTVFSYLVMLILAVICLRYFVGLYPYSIKIMFAPAIVVALISTLCLMTELYAFNYYRIILKAAMLIIFIAYVYNVRNKEM